MELLFSTLLVGFIAYIAVGDTTDARFECTDITENTNH